MAALLLLPLAGADIIIADGKKSVYTVVVPDTSGEKNLDFYVTLAGEMLQHVIKKASGAQLKLVKESEFKGNTPAIYVGNTKALTKAGLSSEKFDLWEHAIAVKGKNIFVYGKDLPSPFKKRAKAYVHMINGTLKGACTFAEKFVNTRFVLCRNHKAGIHDGISTLPQKKITIPEKYFYRKCPQFMSTTGDSLGLFYMIANGWMFYGGNAFNAHSHAVAIPQAKYFKSNPEYFAFINGKRYFCPGGRQPHYCLSNKKVQELIYQELLSRARTGARIVEVGQSDGFKPCECKNCEAWYGVKEWSEKLWCFHRDLAARIWKDSPGTQVSIMCYGPTQKLPTTFTRFKSPNVIIDVAPPRYHILKGLQKFNIKGIVSWTYFFGAYMASSHSPARDFAALQRCAASLYGYRIKGIYNCGQFTAPSLEGPWYYAYGKWLEDKDIPAEKLLDDYCRFSFGEKAAPAFKAFFKAIDERLKAVPLPDPTLDDWNDLEGNKNRSIYAIPFWQKRYPADVMKKLDSLFNKAVALCDPGYHDLHALKTEYEYLRRAAAICNAKKVYDDAPDDVKFAKLLDAVAARNKFIASLPEDKNRKGYIDRKKCYLWTRLSALKDGGYMRGRFGGIFEIDAKLALSARRSTYAVAVKDFKDPAWKEAQEWNLRPMSKGDADIPAAFKMGFNGKGVLIKLKAAAPTVADGVKIKRDGGVWQYPSFDIALFSDPAKPGRHLIFAFHPQSKYDSEVTFRKNQRNLENPKWNGKWQHTSRRVNGLWEAELFIPFADFPADIRKEKKFLAQIGFSLTSQKGHYTWNQPLDGTFVSASGLGTVTLGKAKAAKATVKEFLLHHDFGKAKRLPKYWLTYPSGKLKYGFEGKTLVFSQSNKHVNSSAKKRDPEFHFVSANDRATITVKLSGNGNAQMGAGLYDKKKWLINRGRPGLIPLTGTPKEYTFSFGPDADYLRGAEYFIPSVILRGAGTVKVHEFKVRLEQKK